MFEFLDRSYRQVDMTLSQAWGQEKKVNLTSTVDYQRQHNEPETQSKEETTAAYWCRVTYNGREAIASSQEKRALTSDPYFIENLAQ